MVTMKTWPEKIEPRDEQQNAQQNRRSTDNYQRKRAAERATNRLKIRSQE